MEGVLKGILFGLVRVLSLGSQRALIKRFPSRGTKAGQGTERQKFWSWKQEGRRETREAKLEPQGRTSC